MFIKYIEPTKATGLDKNLNLEQSPLSAKVLPEGEMFSKSMEGVCHFYKNASVCSSLSQYLYQPL